MTGPLTAIDRIIDLPQVSQDLARRVRALERRIAELEDVQEPDQITECMGMTWAPSDDRGMRAPRHATLTLMNGGNRLQIDVADTTLWAEPAELLGILMSMIARLSGDRP